MAKVFQTSVVFGIALHMAFPNELCYPCILSNASINYYSEYSCKHNVALDSIRGSMNTAVNEVNTLIQRIENQANIIGNMKFYRYKNQENFSVPVLHLKAKRKIAFVHESLANLMYVQDFVSNVRKTFGYEESVSMKSLMCLLYQMNRRMQCKKIRRKKPWTNFDKSGACKAKISHNTSIDTPVNSLLKARSALRIMLQTREFWENCVVEKKEQLKVKGKCRKSKRTLKCKEGKCKTSKSKKCRKCKKLRRSRKQKKG